MTLGARVFGFALAAGLAPSVFILLAATGGPVHMFTSREALAEVGGILILVVLPVSLPWVLVGAWSAARITSRQRSRRPLRFWLVRASVAGFLLAAFGATLWFGGMDANYLWKASWDAAPPGTIGPGRWGKLSFILGMALISGLAGACVGVVVGLFCWHSTRRLPPNDALQLTKPAQAMELRS